MGSKSPKWKIKLQRKKLNALRRAARAAGSQEALKKIRRIAHH